MEKTKALFIALLAMFLLNLSTIGFIWYEHAHRPPPPGGPGGGARAMESLMNELSFDKAQRSAYDRLLSEHRKRRSNIDVEVNQIRETLFKGLPTGDTSAASALRNTNIDIELEIFKHLSSVRDLCSAEQKAKFDALIIDALRKSNPNPPPQPPRQ